MKSAPQFFRHGPNLFVRLSFFVLLSLLLMIEDTRFKYFPEIRQTVALVAYPLQKLAQIPITIYDWANESFANFHLVEENYWLKQQHLKSQRQLLRLQALQAENKQLYKLLKAVQKTEGGAIMAEMIYASRDPFNHRAILNKGSQNDIHPGQVVMDDMGVIGQITQVYPWVSEITLITDKDHSVPVQAVRNGLRSVISGAGKNNKLELRYLSVNTDIKLNDLLVTSGIGGVYPSGLPVATVTYIERDPGKTFATIVSTPVAGVSRNRQVLILSLIPPISDHSLELIEINQ